jgi:CPA2 family monovalent cation:H+ antiporter-2
MEFHFFEELATILGAALLVAILFSRLRLPSIIAYMVAGAIIGPQLLGWVEPAGFTLIAEFGVVFLLFSLGLEFSLPRMVALKRPVFGLGGAQVFFTTLIFALTVYWWGATLEAAIVIAGALALSSTAIVTRELAALQQFDSRYAQLAIAVLLFQDLIAVVFLILVPILGGSTDTGIAQQLGSALVKGALLLVLLMSVGKWILPRVYHEVARTRSDDVFVLTTLVIALLAAWLTHTFHLSMALGGFVIGMMLGEGPFRHRIDIEIRPFKDVLLGLFFVTIGMGIDLGVVTQYGLRITLFTAALIVMNVIVVTVLARLMGERRGAALRVGITLAQAGEFGLALIVVAQLHGVLPVEQASFVLAIAVLSMFISPLLIRFVDPIAERILAYWPDSPPEEEEPEPLVTHSGGHVIVGGFGRVGQTLARLLERNNIGYTAIENNAEVVRRQRRRGANVVFGDCSDPRILAQCHITNARLAILTFSSAAAAKFTIEQIRDEGIVTPIIVRCHENSDFDELISLGADRVVPEMLESSLIIGGQMLTFLGLDESEVNQQINDLRLTHRDN